MPRRKKVQPQKPSPQKNSRADYLRAVDEALDDDFGISETLIHDLYSESDTPDDDVPTDPVRLRRSPTPAAVRKIRRKAKKPKR